MGISTIMGRVLKKAAKAAEKAKAADTASKAAPKKSPAKVTPKKAEVKQKAGVAKGKEVMAKADNAAAQKRGAIGKQPVGQNARNEASAIYKLRAAIKEAKAAGANVTPMANELAGIRGARAAQADRLGRNMEQGKANKKPFGGTTPKNPFK